MVRVKGPTGRMRNEYTCTRCQHSFVLANIHVHHEPEVGKEPDWPPTGDGAWERYMLQIHCSVETLFPVCKPCHEAIHKEKK